VLKFIWDHEECWSLVMDVCTGLQRILQSAH
jgi:hypothetical protein